ncbi:MAG: hypothetical protein ACXU8O_03005 [Asticcacaulis sp.]
MARLSLDFAFEGFRVIRARPLLVPIWGVVLLAFYAGVFYLMASTMGPVFADLQTMKTAASADPAAVMALYQRMLPMYAILIPAGLVLGAVMNCAIYRAVLGSSEASFGYLRLGVDELRQIGVNLLFFLLIIGMEFGVGIVAAIVIGISAAAAAKVMPFVMVILVLLLVGLIIWAGVRISLFSVQTFDTRKINLFGSWSLTKGHFWTLLGGYFIMIVMAVVVELLFTVIFGAVGGVAGVAMHLKPVTPNPAEPFAMLYANPFMLVTMAIFTVVLAPLMLALIVAPVAAAYRNLSGRALMGAEKVF